MNIFIFSIIIFLMTSFSNTLSNEQPARLALGLGIFNFMENGSVRCERPENGGCDATSGGASLASYEKSSIVYNLEYYFSNKVFNYIQPSVGFLGTTENAQYGYFGLSLDLFFGNCKCFLLTPGLAAGWYIDGDDIKMGSRIQFKSGADITYRFRNNVRISLAISHLSNAGIGDYNPGSETAMIRYHIPFN